MNKSKVTHIDGKGKGLGQENIGQENFDHFVALDWSMKVMAVAHMTKRSKQPQGFEEDADPKAKRRDRRKGKRLQEGLSQQSSSGVCVH